MSFTEQTDPQADSSSGPKPGNLSRRALLVGMAGVGAVGLVGASGAVPSALGESRATALGVAPGVARTAASPAVGGRIRDTYLAAGGAKVFGRALAAERLVTVNGRHTWGQRFERGQVWWAEGKGRYDLPQGRRVRLSKGPNFRPVLGVRGVYRTDDLDGATALDERIVTDLGITKMIAFNSGGDPRIAGVKKYKYVISNAGSHLTFYRNYVRSAAARAKIGKAMKVIAASTKPVVIHCKAGKDRTGWTAELLQAVAGVSTSARNADYLATRRYSGDKVDLEWLSAARRELASRYGTVENYLTRGCGLSAAQYRALRRRLV